METIHGETSAVNITLAHFQLSHKLEWNTKFETLGADHFIIDITFNTTRSTNLNQSKIIINYKQIQLDIQSMPISHIDTIEQYEKELETIVGINSYEISGTNKFVPKYWWNQKIKNLWIIKNQKLKIFNKYTNTKIEYKKYLAKLKVEIKKPKKK